VESHGGDLEIAVPFAIKDGLLRDEGGQQNSATGLPLLNGMVGLTSGSVLEIHLNLISCEPGDQARSFELTTVQRLGIAWSSPR
jgi:hypothetical protein